MILTRLERGGAVKLTANPQIIEELEALGYVSVGEVIEEEPNILPESEINESDSKITEEAEQVTPFDLMKKDELISFIKSKGATAPSQATKEILIDIAKTLEG